MQKITVICDGGIVQDVIFPPDNDTEVVVRDYDLECDDQNLIFQDEQGKECFESVYRNE